MKKNKYEIDMCNGTLMDKLIVFAVPLMISGVLQLMFNAVDIIVVGQYSGSQSLAAVGSTTALINIFTNLFIGISMGVNVLAARFYAAGQDQQMSETVHTAILVALITGGLSLLGVVITNMMAARRAEQRMVTAQAVTDARLEELTREVRAHNNFAQRVPVLEEQLRVANHRLSNLEKAHTPAGRAIS